jgi:hypothetical protein
MKKKDYKPGSQNNSVLKDEEKRTFMPAGPRYTAAHVTCG